MPLADTSPRVTVRQSAFTLVELLVVIGIIAILIGLLLPVLNKARVQAQQIQCMSNMRQWGMAYLTYADANNQYLPYDAPDGDSGNPVGYWDPNYVMPAQPPLWFNALPPLMGATAYGTLLASITAGNTAALPYDGINNIFICPAAGDAFPATGSGGGGGDSMMAVGVLQFFSMEGYADDGSISYQPTYFCYVPNSKLDQTTKVTKINQIHYSSLTPLMIEKRVNPNEIPSKPGPDGVSWYTETLGRAKADWQRFAGRHRAGGNILFIDGHVDWFLNTDVANPPGANFYNDYNQPNLLIWNPFGPAQVN